MKNQNLKFNVTYTTIDKYIDQDAKNAFLTSVIGESRAITYGTIVPDVKNSKIVNILNNTVDFVDASACSTFANGGTSSITGIPLTVKYLKHEEQFCLNEMEQYWFGKYMPGSNSETLPFEQVFMDEKTKRIAKKIDTIIFQGGNGVDGWLKNAVDGGAVGVTGSSFAVSTAVSNGIINTFDRMVDGLSSDNLEVPKILFVSPKNFNAYVRSLRNLNLYHLNPDDLKNGVTPMFGTSNVTIVASIGMSDVKAFLHDKDYCLFGTDMTPDEEPMNGWYDKPEDKYRVRYKVKIGTALASPTTAVIAS